MGRVDLALRALIVYYKSAYGGKLRTDDVCALTGVSKAQVNRIYATAIERGFKDDGYPIVLKDEWIQDKSRPGRPTVQTSEAREFVIKRIEADRDGHEKTCAALAAELREQGIEISASTVRRMLRKAGYKKTKTTKKPGLTAKMKAERLAWCLEHKDWTLEDWKNVIWTDETAVLLCIRRGGYRVWRKADQKVVKTCIRERWKGYSEFMFWGCFTYDRKGPCHCWRPETAAQKEAAQKDIDQMNAQLEPTLRAEWELNTAMERVGLRSKKGRKPVWKWNKKNGKLERGSKGGIDWYRYQKEILHPKLFPFAKEYMKDRPNTIVQEDKAPCHAHHIQQRFYDLAHVKRMTWCGNSPDLNAIEPCWFRMKKDTSHHMGGPRSLADAIGRWTGTWRDLPQDAIREWIQRIPEHIKKIIELEGGNEYIEGKTHFGPKRPRGRPRKQPKVDLVADIEDDGFKDVDDANDADVVDIEDDGFEDTDDEDDVDVAGVLALLGLL